MISGYEVNIFEKLNNFMLSSVLLLE
ncbi:hypothetical protein EYZ11_004330 [Aspergillus tanneri]|uniref:Uncharacterized protein n=1 Tax=Aspergillus tanneri TaxID=1220188 RepID=A0A4S3JN49_9EURO|nr:hypothetical protein EYZ11_004330 [Aspergillus tanneri]